MTLLACVARASALAASQPTIPIVAEGPDWLVVHKPAGVPCHRRGDDQPGILELVDSAEDLKLAHRLGRRHVRLLGPRQGPAGRRGHRRRLRGETRGQGVRRAHGIEAVEEERSHCGRYGALAAKPVAADARCADLPGLHVALAVDRPGARRGSGRAPPSRETADGENAPDPRRGESPSAPRSWATASTAAGRQMPPPARRRDTHPGRGPRRARAPTRARRSCRGASRTPGARSTSRRSSRTTRAPCGARVSRSARVIMLCFTDYTTVSDPSSSSTSGFATSVSSSGVDAGRSDASAANATITATAPSSCSGPSAAVRIATTALPVHGQNRSWLQKQAM